MSAKTSLLARRAGEVGVDDDFLADVAPPLAPLQLDPVQRDAGSVKAAVEWWLGSLSALGACLAPELQACGDAVLTQAFARGRLAVLERGDRLQGEGEEVRHYTVLLVGACRLRSRGPAPKTAQAPKAAAAQRTKPGDDAANGIGVANETDHTAMDNEGFVHLGMLRRGEPLGLMPGDPRAPWEAACVERTVVLLLGAEDYSSTLKPLQKALHAQAVEFLQQMGVCPQASPFQLQRFVPTLRQRVIQRGTTLLKAGDFQRNVFILRGGSCKLLSPPQEKPFDKDGEENPDDEEEEEKLEAMEQQEWEVQRFERLRGSMHGAERQQQAAADEARNAILAKHAIGNLARVVRAEKGAKPHPNLGVVARKDGLVATALVSEPGAIVGEEVLLYDSYRELVVARSCYTVVVEEDCSVYAVDLTGFQKLASLIGMETIIEKTQRRMNRHLVHHASCRKAAGLVSQGVRRALRHELARQERQMLKLPPCYVGADPVAALENTDDWLQTVFDYRRAPKNEKNPETLQCLEGLGIDMGKGFQTGPGVSAMLQVFNRPSELKAMRSGQRFRRCGAGSRFALPDSNPMGDTIQREARFFETMPPNMLRQPQPAAALDKEPQATLDEGSSCGFFFTELGDSSGLPSSRTPVRAVPPTSGAVPLSACLSSAAAGPRAAPSTNAANVAQAVVRSSSVPALPRLGSSSAGTTAVANEAMAGVVDKRPMALTSEGRSRLVSQSRKGASSTHEAVVAKAFSRAIIGKSVLMLTDKAESRKGVMKAVQSVISTFDLNFVKSSTDLWTRLNAAKEHYHVVVLDLAKNEIQADALVELLRQHTRYAKVPILVLSAARDLSDTIRAHCSFVVFQPLFSSMIREGLLWCLDRDALQPKERRASFERSAGSTASRKALQGASSMPALGLRGAPAVLKAPSSIKGTSPAPSGEMSILAC
eukprot:CAMPEP_0176021650 /NCGR_PEP_ID=MMETSP0120_2-20121206/10517_1 /TAXON_ID=160619 /ORGANISM="Kryptoperidinium foliaceum, Strain CCMP 1326" /LENGTH=935 /DNA_ID=CAMNT_0017354767 /DNA_START=88 /DNA_END=2895 /DNA_ORIENTATION=+